MTGMAGAGPAARAASPLRLLLWLKWTLTWRGYQRDRMKLVGTLVLLLSLLPVSIGAAVFVFLMARAHPWLIPILARDALAAVYLIWVITPLLGFSLNDAYDLTKLFPFPLSYRQIFLGSVLGGLLDLPVLLVLPTLGVLIALCSRSPLLGLWNGLLLLLFLVHTIALGQALSLTLIGFLRSRRFRDITVVLFPLIGMLIYLGQQTLFRQLGAGIEIERVLELPVWGIADWLPPGYAARGLDAALSGRWLWGLPALAGLAAATFLSLGLAATVLKNLFLGDAGPGRPRPAAASAPAPQSRAPGRLPAWLPEDIAAVAGKELTYFRREPQYKALAVQSVYSVALVTIGILLPAGAHETARGTLAWGGKWLFLGISVPLVLSGLPLLFNIFGGEGAAITVLFSLPTPRRALLLGKNLAHGGLLLGLDGPGLVLLAALTGQWDQLPLALAGLVLAAPVLLAAGNLMSIRFPHRMLVRGQRWQKGGLAAAGDGGGAGCGYGLLYGAACAATFVALLPVATAVLAPRAFGLAAGWYVLSLPLALLYALGLYRILLGQAEVWLLAREPEIAARIIPPD